MKYTSAQAAKELRRLSDQHRDLLSQEYMAKEFSACMGEDVESVRPAYNYTATQEELAALEGRIRQLKHALNVFNTTTVVPGFSITVDEMLVYLPQLTARKNKLARMKAVLPKTRTGVAVGNYPDYRYANYDIAVVAAEYEQVAQELATAQSALDLLNNTATFEVD